jgi:transposase-like protein
MPRKARIFSREFKVSVIRRMLAGENVSAIARELQVRRKDLYVWRERFQAGGAEALRGRGRPPKRMATAPPTAAAELVVAPRRVGAERRRVGSPAYAPMHDVASMSRNRLTRPSSCTRTYHEQKSQFRSQGCDVSSRRLDSRNSAGSTKSELS